MSTCKDTARSDIRKMNRFSIFALALIFLVRVSMFLYPLKTEQTQNTTV